MEKDLLPHVKSENQTNITVVLKLTAYLYDCLRGAAITRREERVTITRRRQSGGEKISVVFR